MKNQPSVLYKSKAQRRAHNAARRKRETWMPKLQEHVFRMHRAGKMFR